MEQAPLLNVKEIAKLLNVQPSWIYQRTMKGQDGIPHVRIGKYVRFRPDEVLKFFEQAK